MTRTPLLLIGAGGHARACLDVIEEEDQFEVVGLLGVPDEVGASVLGYPVLGSNTDLLEVASRVGAAFVSVGQIKSPQRRIELFDALAHVGCLVPTIISPRGHVSRHARVGAGTIVMHGAIVNAGATVGRNCILNSLSLVEHDVVVADHCHISTSAAVNSGVRIGAGTFLGSGVTVRQGVTIGERCVVGMGQIVLTDCCDGEWLPRAGIA
jgi:sugar O-acyltransferase (sialic acid O-acetyltransferase NeuD family)